MKFVLGVAVLGVAVLGVVVPGVLGVLAESVSARAPRPYKCGDTYSDVSMTLRFAAAPRSGQGGSNA